MRGDLGAGASEVHEKASAVLSCWFGEVPANQRFVADPVLDQKITARFGAMHDVVLATGAQGWRDDPETLLAAIILLDQFSRNMHRGTAAAFSGDALALDLTREAIERGWDERLDPDEQRAFLYMPLMHAEDPAAQQLSVACFEQLGDAENLAYARDHADVIARFGRFPSRNDALGRKSTPAEKAYLSQPGAGW
jgi:uncharacterized protein (DUF924 family)